MEPRRVSIHCEDRELAGYLALPELPPGRTAPGVILIHEIFGPDAHIQEVARRFAAEGYAALAPNLFTGELEAILTPANIALAMQAFAQAPPDLRRNPAKFAEFAATQPPERRPVLGAFARIQSPDALAGFAQDLLGVHAFLAELSEVDPDRIGSLGFCFGGAMSARLATVDPELRAAVIFYGQNPPLVDVPRIRAALLGLYGAEDPGITGTVPELAEAVRKAGGSFEYRIYPGARHAFFNDTRPNYHADSARDAWPRVLDFFARSLAPGAPPG